MSDSQTLGGCWLPASCFRLSVSGFPSTVARHYGVRIMCRLCSYISPAQKSSAGLLPFKGRGPWLFVTQHGRHKSKSRNAEFIIIAHRATPQPSGRRPVKLTNLKNLQPRRGCQPSPLNPLNLWAQDVPPRVKQISLTSLLSSCIMVHVVVILCR